MKQNIEELTLRRVHLDNELSSENLDSRRRIEIQKELKDINEVIAFLEQIALCDKTITELENFLRIEQNHELQELYSSELAIVEHNKKNLQDQLEDLLYPKDPFDNRSIFLEVRAGTGGKEASLFALDLIKMYMGYALTCNWHTELIDETFTDLGGIREATLYIKGQGVYGALKFESGVHRVQRVPKTETAGRIHTSTATVAVFPEAEDVDVQINPSDLRIDVFRASGAGGQHVNTTDSAVRITHIPTNTVVSCQDERSQHKNKAKALKVLKSRILANQKEKQDEEMMQKRKAMVGTGKRSEKVRTYNFPQNRITDHNAEITLQKLDRVMLGDLDDIIDALKKKEREARIDN